MCYMTKFIDQKLDIREVEGLITAQVAVPADAIWFDGHFPGEPVLPGIAQLAMVVQILGQKLNKPVSVIAVSRVRFRLAISPAEPIEVQITPRASDPLACGFRLMKGSELACSGFLNLAETLSIKGD
jgi:3-hydroxyacyl-[acyl-carrier-protein] dehydratase